MGGIRSEDALGGVRLPQRHLESARCVVTTAIGVTTRPTPPSQTESGRSRSVG